MCSYSHIAGERVCLLPQQILRVEHVHVEETVHVTEHVSNDSSVHTLTEATRTQSHEGTHDVHPSKSQAHSCQLALQGRCIIEERRAQELGDPPFVPPSPGRKKDVAPRGRCRYSPEGPPIAVSHRVQRTPNTRP